MPSPESGMFSDTELQEWYLELEAATLAKENLPKRQVISRKYSACPTPQKAVFYSENQAIVSLEEVATSYRNKDNIPLQTYKCVCGAWHLTSKFRN